MADFIPSNDAEFLQQLIAFDASIGTYASTLGLSPEQLAGITADKNAFSWVVTCTEITRNAGTEMTEWRNISRYGNGDTPVQVQLPVYPAAPLPVSPGIERRFRAIVAQIKASPGYSEAIGKALGIVRETPAPLDLTLVKPSLSVKRDGEDVRIKWNWPSNRTKLQMCEIHVDRNDGKGFTLLIFDTTPNYIDTHEQPAQPVIWTYKAIYRSRDRQVGIWSDPVSITVGG
jgi:hypothetical protein